MNPAAIALVIVPAHNEASVIERCLGALADGTDIEVLVACNGCTDDTASRARRFTGDLRIQVIELAAPSKCAALNAADSASTLFPRMYVDADVVVSGRTVLKIAEILERGPALAARPSIYYDTTNADPVVRAFYRARQRTPPLMYSLWGAGFYGLSRSGRSRWTEFPEGVADDLFADSHFADHETVILHSETVVVRTPRTTRALLHTLQRVYAPHTSETGESQRVRTSLPPVVNARRSRSSAIALVLANLGSPRNLVDVLVYLCLALLARVPLVIGSPRTSWLRDDSSR